MLVSPRIDFIGKYQLMRSGSPSNSFFKRMHSSLLPEISSYLDPASVVRFQMAGKEMKHSVDWRAQMKCYFPDELAEFEIEAMTLSEIKDEGLESKEEKKEERAAVGKQKISYKIVLKRLLAKEKIPLYANRLEGVYRAKRLRLVKEGASITELQDLSVAYFFNEKDRNSRTRAYWANRNNHKHILDYLLSFCLKKEALLSLDNVISGRDELYCQIICFQSGKIEEAMKDKSYHEEMSLERAIAEGNFDFIKKYYDVCAKSPLDHFANQAIWRNQPELLDYLHEEKGLVLNFNMLAKAYTGYNHSTVKYLIKQGISIGDLSGFGRHDESAELLHEERFPDYKEAKNKLKQVIMKLPEQVQDSVQELIYLIGDFEKKSEKDVNILNKAMNATHVYLTSRSLESINTFNELIESLSSSNKWYYIACGMRVLSILMALAVISATVVVINTSGSILLPSIFLGLMVIGGVAASISAKRARSFSSFYKPVCDVIGKVVEETSTYCKP